MSWSWTLLHSTSIRKVLMVLQGWGVVGWKVVLWLEVIAPKLGIFVCSCS